MEEQQQLDNKIIGKGQGNSIEYPETQQNPVDDFLKKVLKLPHNDALENPVLLDLFSGVESLERQLDEVCDSETLYQFCDFLERAVNLITYKCKSMEELCEAFKMMQVLLYKLTDYDYNRFEPENQASEHSAKALYKVANVMRIAKHAVLDVNFSQKYSVFLGKFNVMLDKFNPPTGGMKLPDYNSGLAPESLYYLCLYEDNPDKFKTDKRMLELLLGSICDPNKNFSVFESDHASEVKYASGKFITTPLHRLLLTRNAAILDVLSSYFKIIGLNDIDWAAKEWSFDNAAYNIFGNDLQTAVDCLYVRRKQVSKFIANIFAYENYRQGTTAKIQKVFGIRHIERDDPAYMIELLNLFESSQPPKDIILHLRSLRDFNSASYGDDVFGRGTEATKSIRLMIQQAKERGIFFVPVEAADIREMLCRIVGLLAIANKMSDCAPINHVIISAHASKKSIDLFETLTPTDFNLFMKQKLVEKIKKAIRVNSKPGLTVMLTGCQGDDSSSLNALPDVGESLAELFGAPIQLATDFITVGSTYGFDENFVPKAKFITLGNKQVATRIIIPQH